MAKDEYEQRQFWDEHSMYGTKNMEKESAVFSLSAILKWNKLLLKLRERNYYWKKKNGKS